MASWKPSLPNTYNGRGGFAIHQEVKPTRDAVSMDSGDDGRPQPTGRQQSITVAGVFWLQMQTAITGLHVLPLPGEMRVRSPFGPAR